jgi:anti-sigma factor RsiW
MSETTQKGEPSELTPETMLELMAYADGELEGEDLTRIETLIASNTAAERLVSSMHTLGDCLRVTEAQRPVPKIVNRIAHEVMAQIEAEKARRAVVPLAPRAVRMRNAIVAGTVSAAIAIAAGWAMFVVPPDSGPRPPAPVALAPTVRAPVAPATPVTPTTPDGTGVDLNQVESPAGQVSVFYVPAVAAGIADENVSSVVLWLGPDALEGKGK